jgi:UDPglucose--hexose-1-phosphate uridylyltransferase
MSELRQDMVSGDWIIMAPERAKRPHDFLQSVPPRKPSPIDTCPFEDLVHTGNWPPVSASPHINNWDAVIIPNKYPALTHGPLCAQRFSEGPYTVMAGIGHHELLITRSHSDPLWKLPHDKAVEAFSLLQEHYRVLARDECLAYTLTFFNWGPSAGASLFHPHYQILTLPIIPPDVEHSLHGSHRYFQTHQQCVHCAMISFEQHHGVRIIAENEHAIAFTPFVSRGAFELRVFPKTHLPFFEETSSDVLSGFLEILCTALSYMSENLNDPDRNFFIHTAPLRQHDSYQYYHWHLEIIPKFSTIGGFELGTGIDINVVDPDLAADIIRHGIS